MGPRNSTFAGMDLTPDDFFWVTREIQAVRRRRRASSCAVTLLLCKVYPHSVAAPHLCQIADMCCGGRVVSVLEGGYGCMDEEPVNLAKPGAFGVKPGAASLPKPFSQANERDRLDRVTLTLRVTALLCGHPRIGFDGTVSQPQFDFPRLCSATQGRLMDAACAHLRALVDPYGHVKHHEEERE